MRMLSLKTNILHALKSYFDNEKKVNLQFLIFPEGRTLPLSPIGAFCPAKIVCHVAIVEFSSVSLS